jgi:glycogen debranching enzyme
MQEAKKQTSRLTATEIITLRDNAKHTLSELVTSQGIYASSDNGWKGSYHSWFGRDSAITADLICAAVEYGGDKALAETARQALLSFSVWQGKKDDIETGEEKGKFPHEIRSTFSDVNQIQHARGTNQKPWFIDPQDGLLKNWDSVDSTALWVIATIRLHKTLHEPLSDSTIVTLRFALEWILGNIKEFNGLLAFRGADEIAGRIYSGLHNQGWKDSFQIYQDSDGSLAKHPIKDVLANAEAWTALCLGSEAFVSIDERFSHTLNEMAKALKQRFNSQEEGFHLPDRTYYAQAIDGNDRQLPQISADVAMCLWAYCHDDCIIDVSDVNLIVKKVMSEEMFNVDAGVRNYAIGTTFTQGTRYHGSAYTYWPFVSALIARGFDHFSYAHQATEIINAYLTAVQQLETNIEMFIETSDHRLMSWHHPSVGQESVSEQAWTAAAVYYGTLYLTGDTP